ncbi:MAG: tyrosine-protein phosphatase, partial [Bacteroidaceae bacterium]|nr:tyrosine-protein phosphatase [Bacteroidaceae bacterium]
GTVIGGNVNAKPISLTEDATYEQMITWVGGGHFKIQGTATFPYAFTGTRVRVYNYPSGGNFERRQMWHMHPATAGTFSMDYNLENERVRGFVHDFEYTESDVSKVSIYNVGPPTRRDWPLPVEVFWTQDSTAEAQYITWSESPDFANAMTQSVPTESASYEIYNLIPGRKYYCKVTAENGAGTSELANFSFITSGQMRHLKAEGTANVRDLGGWATESGKVVKYGKLFRGAEWNGGHNLEPEAIEALRQVGIKAELDLRSDSEAKNITKSVLGNDITYKRAPLGQTASHMEGLTNSKSTYKTALQFVLTCVKNNKPVYFHCAIGRDRTGTLAFLLEGVLGMSKSDIYKDYELTNFSYFNTPCSKGQLDAMFAMIEALDGETLEQKFRTYLTTEFGLSNEAIDNFREQMLGEKEDPDGIQVVESRVSRNNNRIYDLSGRMVTGKLQKGIYIVNGKKIVYE